MTRYMLIPETSMYTCNVCFKKYKNSRSLASHRYMQHNNVKDSSRHGLNILEAGKDKQKCIQIIEGKKREDDLDSNRSSEYPYIIGRANESKEKDEGYLSDEGTYCKTDSHSLEDKSEDGLSPTNSDEDSTVTSRKRRGSPPMQPRAKKSRNDKKQSSVSKPDRNIINKKRNESKTINITNAANHAKLIKLLGKAVLDGTIQLQPQHVTVLKPHAKFIRKIAHGRIKDVKATIQNESRKLKQTGLSVLKTVLETVFPILPTLFH